MTDVRPRRFTTAVVERRRVAVASVAAALATVVVVGCASGSDSSFTSPAAADAQARAWVDDAVTSAVPGASTADGHSEGPDSCTSSADFSQFSYSLRVDVPADRVDEVTAAIWARFEQVGFTPSVASEGTSPLPPGPGSPSWTITGFHDGFRLEITGNRVAPTSVSTYLITPCLANA